MWLKGEKTMANINDKLFSMLVRAIAASNKAAKRGKQAMAQRLNAIARVIAQNI